ncbi:Fanconi anemia core complex-associated protein 24 [Amblyraja radiata]|uniref:Fanconi anemia core complex-associated protein 24 n=1 Tax=Amblyraja radiata TaxID=386614 RepID=UPI00140245DD|nr:Fanconi anemia core complex-associated protein 24 [Amblyraja radiata]
MHPVWEVCAGVGSSRTEMDTGLDASVCSPPVRAGASAVPRGHVIASEKWRGSQLTVGCQGRVTVLYEDDLGLVDFHLSQRLCVIYVSESDLVAGNNYRRKLVRFRKASTLNGIVMVEKTPLSEQYFAGVQRFVVLDLGLTLLPVASPTEASQLLAQLVSEPDPAPSPAVPPPPQCPLPSCPTDAALLAQSDVQDKDAAVTMNMFGTLTRDKFEWHPEKLLCKRFNVPDPYPGSTNVGLLKVKRDKYSVFNFLTVPTVAAPSGTVQPSGAQRAGKSSTGVEGKRRSRWDVSAENMEEDGAGPAIPASAPGDSTTPHGGEEPPACLPHDKADTEEEDSRPAMDLFKAVFASSSEERSSSSSSEDEDANQTEAPAEAEEAAQPSHQAAPTRTLPGLVQQLEGGEGSSGTQPRPRSPQTPVGAEEFGPRLPPALVHGAGSVTVETQSEERERHSGGAANREERRREKHSSGSQREEREQKKHKDRRKGKKQKKESKKKHKKHKVRRRTRGGSVGKEEPQALPVLDLQQRRMKNVPLMFH